MKVKVPYFKHNIWEKDIEALSNSLKELYITTWDLVSKFEDKFSKFTNNKYSVWVTSWTAALHLALFLSWIKKDDEVISSSLTWSSAAILTEQMWSKNVFVDIDEKTWLIDTEEILKNITEQTKAIVVTHLYGQMYDTKKLKELLKKYKRKIYIIEDSAHSIESELNWYKPWNYSDFSCFSFQALKNITSVEWWVITTNKRIDYEKLKQLRYLWIDRSAWFNIKELGFKYNMSNTSAALLLWQIEEKRILWNLEKRKNLKDFYNKEFKRNDIDFIDHSIWKSAIHLYVILLKDKKVRDNLKDKLLEKYWIQTNINYIPVHKLSYFKKTYSYKLSHTNKFSERCLTIPLYPDLSIKDAKYVVESIINPI